MKCNILVPAALLCLSAFSSITPDVFADMKALKKPALTISSSFVPRYLEPVRSQLEKGDPTGAIASTRVLDSNLRRRTNPEKIFLLRGLALQSLGQHKDAIVAFEEGLTLKRSSPEILYSLAVSQLQEKLFDAALQSLSEAFWFRKSSVVTPAEIHLQMAAALKEKGDREGAQKKLTQALTENPALLGAQNLMADLELTGGNRNEAIRLFRAATLHDSDNIEAKVNLAQALIQGADRTLNRGEIAEAQKIMSEVSPQISTSSELFAKAVPVRVRALLAGGNTLEAREIILTSLKTQPRNVDFQNLKKQVDLEVQAAQPLQE